MDIAEMAALDALRRAQFQLLRVEAVGEGNVQVRDWVTDEVVPVLDDDIGAVAVGVALVAQFAPMGVN